MTNPRKYGSLLDSLGGQTRENKSDREPLKEESAALQRQAEQLTREAHAAMEQLDAARTARRGFKTRD